MATIDPVRRRIETLVLLCGAAGVGKTTVLYALARQLPSGTHGKVAPLSQAEGRLLRLDYRPHDEELVPGYQASFRLVTGPGELDGALLKPLLSEIDAVLFVVDSTESCAEANAESLAQLADMMAESDRSLEALPVLFLYNKRDKPDISDVAVLEESLNTFGAPHMAASAIRGQGVLDGLQQLTLTLASGLRGLAQEAAALADESEASGEADTVDGEEPSGSPAADAARAAAEDVTAAPGGSAAPLPRGNDDKTDVRSDAAAKVWSWDEPSTGGSGNGNQAVATAVTDWRASAPVDVTAPSGSAAPRRPEGSADVTHPSATGAAVADPDDRTSPHIGVQAMAPAGGDDWTSPYAGASRSSSQSTGEDSTGSFASLIPLESGDGAGSYGGASSPRRTVDPPGAWSSQHAFDQGGADDRTTPPLPRDMPSSVGRPPAAPSWTQESSGRAASQQGILETHEINARSPAAEAWESGLRIAEPVRVQVPELAGYVVSRIGTPRAASRLGIRIPLRATHMESLTAEDFVIDLEFREDDGVQLRSNSSVSRPSSSRVRSGRSRVARPPEGLPVVWFFWLAGCFLLCLLGLIAVLAIRVS